MEWSIRKRMEHYRQDSDRNQNLLLGQKEDIPVLKSSSKRVKRICNRHANEISLSDSKNAIIRVLDPWVMKYLIIAVEDKVTDKT